MKVLSQSQLSMTNQQPITFKHDQLIANHQRARGRISTNEKSRELRTMISDKKLKISMNCIEKKRVCIEFCFKLGKTASESFKMLKQAFKENFLLQSRTFEWFARFEAGRTSVKRHTLADLYR
ncbi:hypothetical protein LAZ67_11001788 [Cordylochernes scorpioides]|uniref:Mos1 transposase HTH domain-containing protein n=1 Tax=Cordylochernes scorpioides TaxID=51811 RepID=A0ABY6L2J2_9ARAC|nr:hypothetical protein LAZ67_11001788 [Cordylochernes scorpioides]